MLLRHVCCKEKLAKLAERSPSRLSGAKSQCEYADIILYLLLMARLGIEQA